MSNNPKIDAAKFKGLARADKLTMQEVAKRCGIGATYLSNVLSGKNRPSPALLSKLAGVVGKDSSEIIQQEDSAGPNGQPSQGEWTVLTILRSLPDSVRKECVAFMLAKAGL